VARRQNPVVEVLEVFGGGFDQRYVGDTHGDRFGY